ncbi:Zn-dependent alcohol dehydrogenase [Sphingobium sp. TKS]|uniref:Zn-dependent alcohol dehydrogenase n=1 Tax=Sphingobium sp. TKS TaxID=1315974 RepID=UPI0007705046|nr:Zn-dependent alcohol dehydrogenase [Sphingobium sp. TKS]AMK25573.1 alcohol dehydrogenase class III [Sphingobium sp. TKS]
MTTGPVRAAVIRQPGRFDIESVTLDTPRSDEIRVRVLASGLCHTDHHVMLGRIPVPFPVVAGHEAAGIVEQIGEEVRDIAVGDLVVTCASVFCGVCAQCQAGHNHRCDTPPGRADWRADPRLRDAAGDPLYQLARLGGFAEAMVVHHRSVVKLPPDMPPVPAALLGCAVLTGYGAVTSAASVRPGSSAAVIGCGGVGLNVIQSAAIAGATRIIAIDRDGTKLEQARLFGATDLVQSHAGLPVAIRDLSDGGIGIDYAFDVVGTPETLRDACHMLKKGGTAVLVGAAQPEGELAIPLCSILFREIKLTGSLMGSTSFQLAMPRLIDFYRQGRLKLDELVSERISLDRINEGYARLNQGLATRIVIEF